MSTYTANELLELFTSYNRPMPPWEYYHYALIMDDVEGLNDNNKVQAALAILPLEDEAETYNYCNSYRAEYKPSKKQYWWWLEKLRAGTL